MLFLFFLMIMLPILGIVFVILLIPKNKKINLRFSFLMGIFFANLGYYFFPKGDVDLVRNIKFLINIGELSLEKVLAKDVELLYVRDIWYWLIAKLGDPQLLPSNVGFIVYFIVFYICFDVYNRCEIYNKDKSQQHLFFISLLSISAVGPFFIISGVRNITCFMIIFFAAYREFVQNKKNLPTYLMYILPCGIHIAGVIILLVRIGLPFFRKHLVFVITCSFFFPFLVDFFYNLFSKISVNFFLFNIIFSVIDKAHLYLHWTEGGMMDFLIEEKSTLYNKYLTLFIFIIVFLLIIYVRIKNKRNGNLKIPFVQDKIGDFYLIVGIIGLGLLYIPVGGSGRFFIALILTISIIIFPLISYSHYGRIKRIILYFELLSIPLFLITVLFHLRFVYKDQLIEGLFCSRLLFNIIKLLLCLC